MSTTSRRTRRHPTPTPPPPSPKILHFPRTRRRTRRKQPKPTTTHQTDTNPLLLMHQKYLSHKGKLFDQENEPPLVLLNSDSKTGSFFHHRRERVEQDEDVTECGGFGEEKWRFQAEILRAECNFLRIEREFALKKLERNRVKMERTLKSAVQTLVSGREKIVEGKNVSAVLEEEIEDLAEKLEDLQKNSTDKDYQVRNCSNFDKKACVLQRRLQKLGGLSDHRLAVDESILSIDNTRDIDKDSIISNSKIENKSDDVELLRKKMEGLSKGILDRVEEEYGSMLSSTANSSVTSSASTSKRIDQLSDVSAFSTRQMYQEQMLNEENKCSGRCKVIIRRIVEQVRAETEQWSQMQEMLGQVRGEMEELQVSRDFWESRVHNSDYEIQSLRQVVEEWKEKALSHEIKANELQLELSELKEVLRKLKKDSNSGQNRDVMPTPNLPLSPLGKQIQKERLASSCRFKENHRLDEKEREFERAIEELNIEENKEITRTKDLPPISLGKQLAKEKSMFLRRLKENRRISEKGNMQELPTHERRKPQPNSTGIVARNRAPLLDIGNSSPLGMGRVNDKEAFTFHSPESFRMRKVLESYQMIDCRDRE